MMGADFSDEQLMSFVDGEVDLCTAERIEAAMHGDTELAARIAIFAETRAIVKDAMEPLLDEPVPATLYSSIEIMIKRHRQQYADASGEVIPLIPRCPQSPAPVRRLTVPFAASVAVVLAGLSGFWLGTQNVTQPQMLSLGPVGERGLSDALATIPGGSARNIPQLGRLRVISSLRDEDGDLCRELELTPRQGSALAFIACHKKGGWTTTFAVAVPGDDGSYAPASSTDTLDTYLSSINASPPLTEAEEKQALSDLE